MVGGVEALLPSRVAGRDREEHGAAPRVRELDASKGEHELEAQERPGARQAHRDSARGRVGVRGERGGVDAVDFVEEQKLAVGVGDTSQGDGEGVVLLAPEGELLGIADAVVFDEPVDVAPVAPVAPVLGHDQVAAR